jgi:hypothetical protein
LLKKLETSTGTNFFSSFLGTICLGTGNCAFFIIGSSTLISSIFLIGILYSSSSSSSIIILFLFVVFSIVSQTGNLFALVTLLFVLDFLSGIASLYSSPKLFY